MQGIQARKAIPRGLVGALFAWIPAWILVSSLGAWACDPDFLRIIGEIASESPRVQPWLNLGHRFSDLSDAYLGRGDVQGTLQAWSSALRELAPDERETASERAALGASAAMIASLTREGNLAAAHDELQRAFRNVIRGMARLPLPRRALALAKAAAIVWNLVEAAGERRSDEFLRLAPTVASAVSDLLAAFGEPGRPREAPALTAAAEKLRVLPPVLQSPWPMEILMATVDLKKSFLDVSGVLSGRLSASDTFRVPSP